MINQNGQVIVNPNIALGMQDFQQLYTGGGLSPEEAAASIHMNFPSEAKTYMGQQWSKLGINQAPEQYFATIANRPQPQQMFAQAQAQRPMMQQQAPDQWRFTSEADRIQQLASGAYDPNYSSPLQKAIAMAHHAIAQKESLQSVQNQKALHPLLSAAPGSKEQALAQMAGDNGDVKEFLLRQQGLTPAQGLGKVPMGYQPKDGLGAGPDAGVARLDNNIYYSEQFQKLAAQDPARAAALYQNLTGRSIDNDITHSIKDRNGVVSMERDFVKKQLVAGATKDASGNWQIMGMPDPDPSNPLAGAPHYQRMPASPLQNAWLNAHSPEYMAAMTPEILHSNHMIDKIKMRQASQDRTQLSGMDKGWSLLDTTAQNMLGVDTSKGLIPYANIVNQPRDVSLNNWGKFWGSSVDTALELPRSTVSASTMPDPSYQAAVAAAMKY